MNEIVKTHNYAQLVEILNQTIKLIEPTFDYRSNQYRTLKRLIRMVEFNRHSHRQDYYQTKADIISILGHMVS